MSDDRAALIAKLRASEKFAREAGMAVASEFAAAAAQIEADGKEIADLRDQLGTAASDSRYARAYGRGYMASGGDGEAD